MNVTLVSHVNGDGDILRAWCRYYRVLGVTSFHLIAHGSEADNATLSELRREFPIKICDAYASPFTTVEKKARLDAVLATLSNQWVLEVDSDEFVELPGRDVAHTVRLLEGVGGSALPAPMIQRIRADGSLASPLIVENPFREFPLCAVNLYRDMGVRAAIDKYPLFYCGQSTRLGEGGNHSVPAGCRGAPSVLQGVTHHFKWRASVIQRLVDRAFGPHSWRYVSHDFLAYLERMGGRLPTAGAFAYSRAELFRRGLLRRPRPLENLLLRIRPTARRWLPPGLRTGLARTYTALGGRSLL